MRRFSITITLAIWAAFAACWSIDNDPGRCYLITGMALIEGDEDAGYNRARQVWDQWPKTGKVARVWFEYNQDPRRVLYLDFSVTDQDIEHWAACGYQFAVAYRVSDSDEYDYHTLYVSDPNEVIAEDVVEAYIVVDFNSDLKCGLPSNMWVQQ